MSRKRTRQPKKSPSDQAVQQEADKEKLALNDSADEVVSESPVVSDDDGIDDTSRADGAELAAPDDVEVISDEESEEDDDEDEQVDQEVDRRRRAFDDGGSDSDSSTEGAENPVGDIPMRWYEGYEHIGYTRDGEKMVPKNRPNALELAADPHSWRRIYDDKNDEEIVLSHAELKAIARMRVGRNPHGTGEEHGELIAWSGAVRSEPLPSGVEPKRRFLPSRHEHRTVVRYVRAMREGTMRRPSEKRQRNDDATLRYDLWAGHEPKTRDEMSKSERARDIMRVPAPKVPLPKHDESYNPPPEYLPSKDERVQWEGAAPEDRAQNYLPTKSDCLRHVPGYANLVRERFERCLDLYLAVRIKKEQQNIDPDELLPKLPSPRDLRPFPTAKVLEFAKLDTHVRSISVHPAGQWLLSASDDGVVRMWESCTGFLRAQWDFSKLVKDSEGKVLPVMNVAWRPAKDSFVFATCVGSSLFVVSAANALGVTDVDAEGLLFGQDGQPKDDEDADGKKDVDEDVEEEEEGEEKEGKEDDEDEVSKKDDKKIRWKEVRIQATSCGKTGETKCDALQVTHTRILRSCTWHRKGDYLGIVGRDSNSGIVAIHRVTKRSSRILFKRRSSNVTCVRFHPTRPFFLVATLHHVRIYNLAQQQAAKVLKPGVTMISDIDVHSSGDHVLVASYDRKLCWHDLDLSVRPYKTIRNHNMAVRAARFHPKLPLFADASDDGAVHVFHGMVYDDLSKNSLIVPVRRLINAHEVRKSLGVLDIAWHPVLPWLFSAGADGKICVFVDNS